MTPAAQVAVRAALQGAAGLMAAGLLVLAVLLVVLMARSRSRCAREAASAAARPLLHQFVVAYLEGNPETEGLRRYLAQQRGDVADTLLLFQSTVAGTARERLCNLALDFGLVRDWCEEGRSRDVVRRRTAFSRLAFVCVHEPARLVAGDLLLRGIEDPDAEVRLAAARGLLQAHGEQEAERVFHLAVAPNLLTRVVLTEDLRRHAMALCGGPMTTILRSEDLPRIRAVLEILVTWERTVPLDDVREFLDHRDRRIRVLAFRLAPLVSPNFDSRLAILRALNDPDYEIRTLAVITVGRLKMAEAMPELALCMRHGDLDLAYHAAEALTAMPRGVETLGELSAGVHPQAARVASEVLARTRSDS